jgi:hypothetical protein
MQEPITVGGYFMNQEAEKAKLYDMLQEQRKICGHLGALDDEFKKIAEAWSQMAMAFRMVDGVTFTLTDEGIRAVNDYTKATISVLPKQYLSYETITRLISDLEASRRRKADLNKNLEPSGLL